MQEIYHRMRGRMADAVRAERRRLAIEESLERAVEQVTTNVDEGDYFDPEAARALHRRQVAVAGIATSLLAIIGQPEATAPEAELDLREHQVRVDEALERASATVPRTTGPWFKRSSCGTNVRGRCRAPQLHPERRRETRGGPPRDAPASHQRQAEVMR